MIFSWYKETCEVLLYYSKIVAENIKESEKKGIKNILHANIDVQSIILIAEFLWDGINVLKNCNHIVPTWLFMKKVGMIDFPESNT